jgi:hypothetical protein
VAADDETVAPVGTEASARTGTGVEAGAAAADTMASLATGAEVAVVPGTGSIVGSAARVAGMVSDVVEAARAFGSRAIKAGKSSSSEDTP